MSNTVTISIPHEIYERASVMAQRVAENTDAIIVETLNASLPSPQSLYTDNNAVSAMTDGEVLRVANSMMRPESGERLNYLTAKRQDETLSFVDELELAYLMNVYRVGLVRKSAGLAEAVKRGLLPSLATL